MFGIIILEMVNVLVMIFGEVLSLHTRTDSEVHFLAAKMSIHSNKLRNALKKAALLFILDVYVLHI